MAVFVVTYTHSGDEAWEAHVAAHVDWLVRQVEARWVMASGPFVGSAVRSAMLVMEAADRESLEETIATVPSRAEGVIDEMTVTGWDPIFGAFAAKGRADRVPDDEHGGPDLQSKVDAVARISPPLQRLLAGAGPMLRDAAIGNREWGLLTMAMLIAIRDAPEIADGVPRCRYVLVDPGTHMMPMEQPDALAAALLEFRRDVEAGALSDV